MGWVYSGGYMCYIAIYAGLIMHMAVVEVEFKDGTVETYTIETEECIGDNIKRIVIEMDDKGIDLPK